MASEIEDSLGVLCTTVIFFVSLVFYQRDTSNIGMDDVLGNLGLTMLSKPGSQLVTTARL